MVDQNIFNKNKRLEDKLFLKRKSDKEYYVNFLCFWGVFSWIYGSVVFASYLALARLSSCRPLCFLMAKNRWGGSPHPIRRVVR